MEQQQRGSSYREPYRNGYRVSAGSAIISYRIGSAYSTFTIAINSNPPPVTAAEKFVFSLNYF